MHLAGVLEGRQEDKHFKGGICPDRVLPARRPSVTRGANRLCVQCDVRARSRLLLGLGYYAVRLTWSIVPPLLVASGIIVVGSTARLSVTARRLLVGALVLFAAGLDYHTIVKLGPWC